MFDEFSNQKKTYSFPTSEKIPTCPADRKGHMQTRLTGTRSQLNWFCCCFYNLDLKWWVTVLTRTSLQTNTVLQNPESAPGWRQYSDKPRNSTLHCYIANSSQRENNHSTVWTTVICRGEKNDEFDWEFNLSFWPHEAWRFAWLLFISLSSCNVVWKVLWRSKILAECKTLSL